ncbi:transposase [Chlamydiota bacterium]
MPRKARIHIPGGIYHVISRGIERRDIFLDDDDRNNFLTRLEVNLDKTGSQCLAWVLMSNHFHLLIRTGTKSLSELMRKLLTGYALSFNRDHNRNGYLFQSRYKSVLCQEDVYLQQLVRYIHINPIRAGVVMSMAEMDRYPWSGHSAIMGIVNRSWQERDEVLAYFGKQKQEAIRKYRAFIQDGIEEGEREDLMGGGLKRSVGGWEGVMDLKREKEAWQSDERLLGDGIFVEQVLKAADEKLEKRERLQKEGWTLERLSQEVCKEYGLKEIEIRRQGKGKIAEARNVVCYKGNREIGISTKELSEYLGISRGAVSKSIERGEKYLMKQKNIR